MKPADEFNHFIMELANYNFKSKPVGSREAA